MPRQIHQTVSPPERYHQPGHAGIPLFAEDFMASKTSEIALITLALRLNTSIVSAQNEQEILQVFHTFLDEAAHLYLFYLDSDGTQNETSAISLAALYPDPETLAVTSRDMQTNPLLLGFISRLFAQSDPVSFFENVTALPLRSPLERVSSLLAMPIEGRTDDAHNERSRHAVLCIAWEAPRKFDSQERRLYATVSTTASVAISKHRLQARLLARTRQLEEANNHLA